MASVFLSYDRDDATKARPIAAALERAGHSVWWDQHIGGGTQYAKEIEGALNSADVVVVLWSRAAVESAWVRDEAGAGRDKGRLVPLSIDGTAAPLGFRQFQSIDLGAWRGRGKVPHLQEILAAIERHSKATSGLEAVQPTRVAEPRSGPSLNMWAFIGVLVAIGFVAIGLLIGRPWERTFSGVPTISVVPADASSASQVMAREVLTSLGSLQGTSATNFRLIENGSNDRPDLRLSVSDTQQGSTHHATVALASSTQSGILWSRQIEEPAAQRSSLGQAAAYAAMSAIACATDDPTNESRRLTAMDLQAYLNACASSDEADPRDLVAIFRKTTRAAPRFAAAWAHLLNAESYILYDSIASGGPVEKIESALRQDMQAARRIEPDLAEVTIAEVNLQPPTSFLARISLLDKAVAAHPGNADLLSARAQQLSSVGRMNDAFSDHQRAAELKPYSAALRANYIVALASSGGVVKAWADLAEAKKLWPDSSVIASTDTSINLRYGDFEKTWRDAGYEIDGGITGYFKILREPTDANIDAWVNLAKTHEMLRPHRYFILQALGPLNRVDQLYAFLDQWPMDQDLQGLTYILFRPWTAKVRRDPRFIRFAQGLGLVDYWEKSGQWPDFCAQPDMPYDCKAEAAKLQ